MAQQPALSLVEKSDRIAGATLPSRCAQCGIRETSLCGSMSDAELADLSEIGRRRKISRGQVISWAGDPSRSCANVVSGALKVTATLADGREQIVGLLFPGDFVGQLFSDDETMTVTALTNGDLCSYPRVAFEGALDAHPKVERMLFKKALAALNDARGQMLSLGRKSAQERVAGFILDLAARTGQRHPAGEVSVHLPISRGEIADFLGLTIETVSRQFTRLKAQNIIAFARGDRDCRILNFARLDAIVNPE